jgi:alkanesulfonate monooxygenase SsuD/methylene tetrahydromethanopterin reductase-like flavin-dependent oxidoreductase (luciferase family)
MKLGLHVPDFTWKGGPATLGSDLVRVATTAEAVGFDRISVMDHLFQMVRRGGPEKEMLESTTALGFLAGNTSRVKLLALVSGVVYREPGLLAKSVTTLDVLSDPSRESTTSWPGRSTTHRRSLDPTRRS